jgi:hypothetical protein
MVHYAVDYAKAKMEEARIFPYLKEYFKSPNMSPTAGQYEQYDFVDDQYNYEVKTRFDVKRDQYDTTLIQSDKFYPRGKFQGKPVILIFNFVDYLCYIKYDRELFKHFLTTEFSRQKDQVNYSSPHTYIPRDYLTTICKWNDLTGCDDCGRIYPREMMGYLDGEGLTSNLYYCPVCLESDEFEIEYTLG